MKRWRGEPDPRHVKAVDAYFISAAEHGMNASTFTARVVASTGADVAACISSGIGALSGPLHGGAPSRVLHMIEEVERSGDAEGYVKGVLDRGERLMGFGHRVYRAEDPRARVLRRTAKELGAPRYEVAEALEKAALEELHARRPDRVLATNVEFWSAVVLDFAEVPAHMFTSMFTCARVAGWSAHILEQKKLDRLVRPSATYVGPGPRKPSDVEGWDRIPHGADLPHAPGPAALNSAAGPLPCAHSCNRSGVRAAGSGVPGRGDGRRVGGRAPGRMFRVADSASIAIPDDDQARRRPVRLRARARSAPSAVAGARRAPARPSWAPRTGRRRSATRSPGCAAASPSCSRCPTATRSSSATAAPPRSGRSPRSA